MKELRRLFSKLQKLQKPHDTLREQDILQRATNVVDFFGRTPSLPRPPWHYSPECALAFKGVFHSSRLAAITFQPLHLTLTFSSSIFSSYLNLGLPIGSLPPGSSISTSFAG
jgi:hypothetical protein